MTNNRTAIPLCNTFELRRTVGYHKHLFALPEKKKSYKPFNWPFFPTRSVDAKERNRNPPKK